MPAKCLPRTSLAFVGEEINHQKKKRFLVCPWKRSLRTIESKTLIFQPPQIIFSRRHIKAQRKLIQIQRGVKTEWFGER